MDTWMQFESGEAEYLARIRGEGEQQRQRRVPRSEARASRTVRTALAAALVALAGRIAPAACELSRQDAPLAGATQS